MHNIICYDEETRQHYTCRCGITFKESLWNIFVLFMCVYLGEFLNSKSITSLLLIFTPSVARLKYLISADEKLTFIYLARLQNNLYINYKMSKRQIVLEIFNSLRNMILRIWYAFLIINGKWIRRELWLTYYNKKVQLQFHFTSPLKCTPSIQRIALFWFSWRLFLPNIQIKTECQITYLLFIIIKRMCTHLTTHLPVLHEMIYKTLVSNFMLYFYMCNKSISAQ